MITEYPNAGRDYHITSHPNITLLYGFKAHSHRVEVEAKAKTSFDFCRIFFDLYRFHSCERTLKGRFYSKLWKSLGRNMQKKTISREISYKIQIFH